MTRSYICVTLKLLKVTSNTIIRLLHVKYKTTHSKTVILLQVLYYTKLLQDYKYQ